LKHIHGILSLQIQKRDEMITHTPFVLDLPILTYPTKSIKYKNTIIGIYINFLIPSDMYSYRVIKKNE